jgi:glycogen(starch) synthase
VFPSFYEPWGYTPLECIARGVPTVTSDLSGFGTYLLENMPHHEDKGIYVLPRRANSSDRAAQLLADWLLAFTQLDRRDRITQRNRVESCATQFDWDHLAAHYDQAHAQALAIGQA